MNIRAELYDWCSLIVFMTPGQIGNKLRYYYLKQCLAKLGKNLYVSPWFWINGPKNIVIGDDVSIGRNNIFESEEGQISIGNRVAFNSGIVLGADFSSIIIGDDVIIGMNTVIRSANHRFDKSPEITIREQGHIGEPIVICDDVWIGANVTILPGVEIGSHCVIGSGAVVTKSIPSSSVACGVPAKIIRKL